MAARKTTHAPSMPPKQINPPSRAEWRKAGELRAFCDALEHAAAGQAASSGGLADWLTWARARADKIDPTVGTPTLTSIDFTIEPSPEDLRPHLNGWDLNRPAKK